MRRVTESTGAADVDADNEDEDDFGPMQLPTLKELFGKGRSTAQGTWTREDYMRLAAARDGVPPSYSGHRLRDKQSPDQHLGAK